MSSGVREPGATHSGPQCSSVFLFASGHVARICTSNRNGASTPGKVGPAQGSGPCVQTAGGCSKPWRRSGNGCRISGFMSGTRNTGGLDGRRPHLPGFEIPNFGDDGCAEIPRFLQGDDLLAERCEGVGRRRGYRYRRSIVARAE